MRDANLNVVPFRSRRAEFWLDVFVWVCSVVYGLMVGAVVAFVVVVAWMRWGW